MPSNKKTPFLSNIDQLKNVMNGSINIVHIIHQSLFYYNQILRINEDQTLCEFCSCYNPSKKVKTFLNLVLNSHMLE